MKLLPLAAGIVLPLALAGAAVAQGVTPEQFVRSLITTSVDDDETLVGDIKVQKVKALGGADMTFDLDPSKTYLVYGVCDANCTNLDLYADDVDGQQFDSDEQDDNTPMIFVLPGDAGDRLTIRADMTGCDAEACVMAVAVYEQGS